MRSRPPEQPQPKKTKGRAATRAAGKALRKIMPGDTQTERQSVGKALHHTADIVEKEDPRHGLSERFPQKRSHYMLMLKPQVVLRSENGAGSDLIAVGTYSRGAIPSQKLPDFAFSKHRLTPQLHYHGSKPFGRSRSWCSDA